jgi:hypothetical protein
VLILSCVFQEKPVKLAFDLDVGSEKKRNQGKMPVFLFDF